MKAKKVIRDEHGRRHVTPAGRSVFYDLFPNAEADELVMRSTLLRGLEQWLKESGLTQTQAAKALCESRLFMRPGQIAAQLITRLSCRVSGN